ncbi:sigma factor [Dactylosporangium darangshiense]|uniref:sigma factor n=1 Tax=Dactylosporangium darangshiense TaxID=579108 RepID=UPI00362BAD9B
MAAHLPLVYTIVRRALAGRPGAVDDVVQETMLRALRQLRRCAIRTASGPGWPRSPSGRPAPTCSANASPSGGGRRWTISPRRPTRTTSSRSPSCGWSSPASGGRSGRPSAGSTPTTGCCGRSGGSRSARS